MSEYYLFSQAEISFLRKTLGPLSGGTGGAVLKKFSDRADSADRDAKIRFIANDGGTEATLRDGELELDDNAVISEGEDNGAYVMAWIWVDFAGTEFDKDPEVRVYKDPGGELEGTCSFGEAMGDLETEECQKIYEELMRTGTAMYGGGAVPRVRLERVAESETA